MYDSNAVQLSQLTNELGQIQHVMAKNIEVRGQGYERLQTRAYLGCFAGAFVLIHDSCKVNDWVN